MALLSEYDYDLPESMIASAPMEPRDACQMLVYNRSTMQTEIKKFRDILTYLQHKTSTYSILNVVVII